MLLWHHSGCIGRGRNIHSGHLYCAGTVGWRSRIRSEQRWCNKHAKRVHLHCSRYVCRAPFYSINWMHAGALSVSAIWPRSGVTAGGTNVLVYGSNFVNSVYLRCKFGTSAATAGVWQSASVVQCVSPAGTGSGALEVSNNNVDFTAAGLQFVYNGACWCLLIRATHSRHCLQRRSRCPL